MNFIPDDELMVSELTFAFPMTCCVIPYSRASLCCLQTSDAEFEQVPTGLHKAGLPTCVNKAQRKNSTVHCVKTSTALFQPNNLFSRYRGSSRSYSTVLKAVKSESLHEWASPLVSFITTRWCCKQLSCRILMMISSYSTVELTCIFNMSYRIVSIWRGMEAWKKH